MNHRVAVVGRAVGDWIAGRCFRGLKITVNIFIETKCVGGVINKGMAYVCDDFQKGFG